MEEEKIKQLKEISKPIIEFMQKNYNPHTTVIINEDSIKVVSDELRIPIQID